MPISQKQGNQFLKQFLSSHFRFSIPANKLSDMLPQVVGPSAYEMGLAVDCRLLNMKEPKAITMKLEAMDMNEFLDSFCKEYGFNWWYDPERDYIN